MAEVIIMENLIYSDDRTGPFRLYVYDDSGYHRGGQWFVARGQPIQYPEDEIICEEAFIRAMEAFSERREVRVTDGGDRLVFHQKDGEILYPKTGNFWKEIGVA